MQLNGVNEITEALNVSVYPNPNNGVINLKLTEYENINIEVYNLVGEKVFTEKLQNTITQINLNNLSCGLYLVKLFKNDAPVYQAKISKVD